MDVTEKSRKYPLRKTFWASLGGRLQQARETVRPELTQQRCAELIGKKKADEYGLFERGKRKLRNVDHLRILAEATSKPLLWLVLGIDPKLFPDEYAAIDHEWKETIAEHGEFYDGKFTLEDLMQESWMKLAGRVLMREQQITKMRHQLDNQEYLIISLQQRVTELESHLKHVKNDEQTPKGDM